MADLLHPARGQGGELRELLEQALSIPAHAKWFTVRFALDEPVSVMCEYHPHELPMEPDDEADPPPLPDQYRGLNG